jgi:macrolide phosphotransferase
MIRNVKSQQEVLELAHKNGLTIEAGSIQFTDVNGIRWVLHLPRREDVLPPVDKERRTLELIAPRLSVDAPRWAIYSDELIV